MANEYCCPECASATGKVWPQDYKGDVMQGSVKTIRFSCNHCGNEITMGLHDHLWRHVLGEDNYPIQCPNAKTLAMPAAARDSCGEEHA